MSKDAPSPPPATETRAARRPPSSDKRRAELLALAASMFAKEGYQGTGMRSLAERAGINAATLYYYFRSKEEVLLEICLAGARGTAQRIHVAMQEKSSMADRLHQITRDHIADLAAHSDARHVYFEMLKDLDQEQRKAIDDISRQIRHMLDQLFVDALGAGEMSSSLAPRSASLVFAALLRALTRYYVEGPVRDYPAVAHALCETTICGLQKYRAEDEGGAR